MTLSPTNNFDLIRLYAASQVFGIHILTHFQIIDTLTHPVTRILNFFPGVPIFFFISGFLISASFKRSTVKQFFKNRALRIFPGLWICLLFSIISVWFVGYFETIIVPIHTFIFWFFGQLSVIQFYNPDFLRNYGVGALNGSLWSITVELQFYALVPIIFSLHKFNYKIFILFFYLFAIFNIIYTIIFMPYYSQNIFVKLYSVTFIPWIAIFILGYIAQHYWIHIKILCEDKFRTWIIIYLVLVVLGIWLEDVTGYRLSGNRITPLHYIPLAFVALSAAFTNPNLSDRLLGGNDISYGVYIYHMPVINMWLWLNWGGSIVSIVLVVLTVILVASISWIAIERPTLRFKRVTLFQR